MSKEDPNKRHPEVIRLLNEHERIRRDIAFREEELQGIEDDLQTDYGIDPDKVIPTL